MKNTKTAAIHENVSKPLILVSTVVALLCRYTGCEKANLTVRLAGSSTTIAVNLISAVSIVDLFRQVHSKLD